MKRRMSCSASWTVAASSGSSSSAAAGSGRRSRSATEARGVSRPATSGPPGSAHKRRRARRRRRSAVDHAADDPERPSALRATAFVLVRADVCRGALRAWAASPLVAHDRDPVRAAGVPARGRLARGDREQRSRDLGREHRRTTARPGRGQVGPCPRSMAAGIATPAAARGPPGVGRDRRAPDVALRSGAFATPRRARTPRSRATRSARRALPWLPRPSRRRPIRLRKAQRRPRRPRARRPTGRSRRPWACTRRAPRSDARSTPWPRASTARPPISTKRSPRLTARTLRSAKLRASCAREAGRRVNEAGPRGALDAGSRAPMPSNSPSQRSNRGACLRGKAARPVAMNKGPEARSDVAEPSPGPASRASRPVLATSRRRRFQGPIRRRIARGVRSSGAAQHAGRCTGGRRWCRSQRACVDDRRCVGDGRSSTTADVVAAATTAVGGVVPVGRRLANERRRRTARARRGGRGARSRSPS